MGSIFGNNKLFNNQNFSNSSGFGQNDFYNDSFGNGYSPQQMVHRSVNFVKKNKFGFSALLLFIPIIILMVIGFRKKNYKLVFMCFALLITIAVLGGAIAYRMGKPNQLMLLIFLIIIEIGFIIYLLTTITLKTNRNMYVVFYTPSTYASNKGEHLFYYEGKKNNILDIMKGTNYSFALKEDLPVDLGTEGSYSFWIKVCPDNFNKGNKKWRTVWYRGNDTGDNLFKMKTPGVYLAPNTNKMIITLACENGPDEGNAITLDDIPLNEWFCVTIVLEGRSLDCYVNGLLERSIVLTGSPLMMNTNVIKGVNGFNGLLAFFRYSPSALVPKKIKDLYERERETLESSEYDLETCVNK